MITAADVAGVHIKYLYHCRRQLWLYLRGVRPEHLSAAVQLGEAVHETSFSRSAPIDLGAAKIDFVDGELWVHEVKSSARPSPADRAQGRHYCHQLARIGVEPEGAILHYPKTRRTDRFPYADDEIRSATADIEEVLAVAELAMSPERLARSRCRGCSFADYCWME